MFNAANPRVPEPGEQQAKPSGRKRVTAIDAARCLALIGMMGIHVLPEEHSGGNPSLTWVLFAGRASALFALLAGVSLAFSSGGTRPLRGRPLKAAMAGVAARALVIMAIGMLLAYAGPDVEIILAYYGVMFLLAVPLLGLTPRVLAVLSAVFAIGGPILLQAVRNVIPAPEEDNLTFGTLFTEPFSTVGQLLFTGFYPAVPWMAYMCAGLAIGKLDLSSRRIAAWLAAGGACLAAAAWALSWLLMIGVLQLSPGESAGLLVAGEDPPVDEDDWAWLVAASPYSSMPLELLHTIGTSMVALGVLILAGKYIHQIIDVLAPAGSMTLTLYSGHLLFLASGVLGEEPFASFGLQVGAALLFGVLWRNLAGRGPLESAVSAVATRARNAVLGKETTKAGKPDPDKQDSDRPGAARPSGP
ncbi:heparan-alpha-glucosaminide N-acetyltransferase domain-containing protein [Paeniglutamicibacter kerguelensis]|uniref:Membrane protein n=1 Tax=Paeniglutamicibacter kerguelensis TaxID=254788 RepID=A0ABS4XBG0_9MICC|nr:heparan-alpha-glucosaminide N-acetyltransferase domain-containing protein [Paeniglutamicibacter kerguelensis]MBP2385817.1 putative membrane protein [Paeniglutamicibacter kerguelensis]